MHSQMVELVSEALVDGTPIAVSLPNTLNAVTSRQAERLAPVRDRVPTIIVVLLLLSAVVSAMLVGREQGVADEEDLAGTICFIVLVSCVIFVTLDLISLTAAPYPWTRSRSNDCYQRCLSRGRSGVF